MFDWISRIDDKTSFIVEWFVKTVGVEVWSVKEGEQRFETHVDKLTNYNQESYVNVKGRQIMSRKKCLQSVLQYDNIYLVAK